MTRHGFLAAAVLTAAAGRAAASGTTGAELMGRPQGARPMALAESYVSLADDPYALVYNPAGLGLTRRAQAVSSFETGMAGVSVASLLASAPLGRYGGFGAGLTTLDAGRITVFNADGSQDSRSAEQDMLFTAGWGWATRPELSDWGRFAGGAAFKYFQSTLVEQAHASAQAVDLGGLWETPAGLMVGASLSNLGGDVGYSGGMAGGAADPLPRTLRLGASGVLPFDGRNLLATADLISARDEPQRVGLGFEYTLARFLRLRAGYQFNDALGSITTGVGLRKDGFSFDYGFALNSELGDQQFFALSFEFGRPEERRSFAEVKQAHLDKIARYPEALYARRRYFEATVAAQDDPALSKSSETVARIHERVVAILAAGLREDATAYAYAQAYQSRFEDAPAWPQVVADLEQALVRDPYNDELQGELIRAREKSVRQMRELAVRADALYQKALDAYQSKDYRAALSFLREALKLNPAHESALKLMDLAIQGSVEAQLRAGLEERRAAVPPPAVEPPAVSTAAAPAPFAAARPAPTFDPEKAEKLYREGLIAYANGDLKKAAADWEEALRLDPYHQRAKNALERAREDLRAPTP